MIEQILNSSKLFKEARLLPHKLGILSKHIVDTKWIVTYKQKMV